MNLKELEKQMKRERKWNLLQRVTQEGIYSLRHIRGYHTGVICYVVMAGGTILSAHLDKQEALDNWHALLNGVSTVNNDTCEIDGV